MANDGLGAVERALEQLLRLSSSRKVHARQATAAGVVLSQPGLALLRRLHEDGATTLGELAKRTHMDPAATGRQVRLLEEDGLVRKETSAGDGRVTVVRLTPKGTAARRRISQVTGRHLDEVLGTWSKDDRAALGRLLSRLVDDLRIVRYHSMSDEQAG